MHSPNIASLESAKSIIANAVAAICHAKIDGNYCCTISFPSADVEDSKGSSLWASRLEKIEEILKMPLGFSEEKKEAKIFVLNAVAYVNKLQKIGLTNVQIEEFWFEVLNHLDGVLLVESRSSLMEKRDDYARSVSRSSGSKLKNVGLSADFFDKGSKNSITKLAQMLIVREAA